MAPDQSLHPKYVADMYILDVGKTMKLCVHAILTHCIWELYTLNTMGYSVVDILGN